MLKSEDFIRLGSNLIDNNGENNIKIAEVLTHSQNVSVKIYDSLLKLFVLDELTGKNLDDYGARFNVPRQNLNDNDYRALIKAMSIIKFKGNTYNSITEALALYLRVSESAITLSEIQPDDTDYPRFTLIKHIIVKDTIDNFKLAGKTVIVIAHRLSTIANSDTILVMENGVIVENGNHLNLLSQKGKYFELWNKQSLV